MACRTGDTASVASPVGLYALPCLAPDDRFSSPASAEFTDVDAVGKQFRDVLRLQVGPFGDLSVGQAGRRQVEHHAQHGHRLGVLHEARGTTAIALEAEGWSATGLAQTKALGLQSLRDASPQLAAVRLGVHRLVGPLLPPPFVRREDGVIHEVDDGPSGVHVMSGVDGVAEVPREARDVTYEEHVEIGARSAEHVEELLGVSDGSARVRDLEVESRVGGRCVYQAEPLDGSVLMRSLGFRAEGIPLPSDGVAQLGISLASGLPRPPGCS